MSFLVSCSNPSPVVEATVENSSSTAKPEINSTTPTTIIRETLVPQTTKDQSELKTPPLIDYTHQNPDGNRVVTGLGDIPNLAPIRIPLSGTPTWVVAIPFGKGSLWAVTLDDGHVQGFQIEAGAWQSVDLEPPQLSAGQPPLLHNSSEAALLVAPSDSASILTHSVPIQESDWSQVFIDEDGNLVRVEKNSQLLPKLAVDALPDARILQDENQQLLLLTGPATRYNHGVLGDAVEANQITLIPDLTSGWPVTISMSGDLVIEGLAPIWVDWDGDGNREIIVTVSDALQGAQILMFNEAGEQIAAGPAIGQGYRWRHQIAVAPFGPSGEMELADVLTPHLGGVVEFYRWDGNQLKIVAQLSGYTSHVIGTRNLDMAVAGDFDGDGMVELLLPRQDRLELGAIHRIENGASVDWSLPLKAKLATNIGAVNLKDDSLAIGVGLENGILTIWHP